MTENAVEDEHGSEAYDPDLYVPTGEAEPVNGLEHVGDAEIERFKAQGFLAVESAFSDAQMADAIKAVEELIDGNSTLSPPASARTRPQERNASPCTAAKARTRPAENYSSTSTFFLSLPVLLSHRRHPTKPLVKPSRARFFVFIPSDRLLASKRRACSC